MVAFVKRTDSWLHQHLTILLLLLFLVVLRVPNFFEPYWYGDEGIYLTIGNGIRHGERLYTQIVDHKTPIIYYLAAVPSQLQFRLLLVGWMLITTVAFFAFAKKLLNDHVASTIASTVFVILTSLPWFEGNIPNGELFVMGFVMVGAWVLSKTTLFDTFMEKVHRVEVKKDLPLVGVAGFLFGLAILTKVPALFDWVAFLFLGWLIVVNQLSFKPHTMQEWLRVVGAVGLELVVFAVGVLIPIALSIIYFIAVGSGKDYLDYGLLYNFRYAANWALPFKNMLLEKAFTLPGKALITGVILMVLSIRKQWFSRPYQFVVGWFMLALFASLLSNRPYPHYFQQVVPPLALLLGMSFVQIEHITRHAKELAFSCLALGVFFAALILLQFAPYSTTEYYSRFINLLSGRWSLAEYRQSFNPYMTDNYKAATLIRKSDVNQIFIWGTNPMLYALSDTYPVGKYTVSFHIKDFKAEPETMQAIEKQKPQFIVTMNDETEKLPGLDSYLMDHYVMNTGFQHFTLWERSEVMSKASLL